MMILENALIISLFCCGLRAVSSKNLILEFVRMPYLWATDMVNKTKHGNSARTRHHFKYKAIYWILKALTGCVVCMSGIYTGLMDLCYYELSKWTILTIFTVACMNAIIYGIYELITAMIEYYTKTSCK